MINDTNNEYYEIKSFLDEFNALLKEFPIIRDKIYRLKSDELGFAYIEYSENRVYYTFYPISNTDEDIIKKIDKKDKFKISSKWYQNSLNNPIKVDPKGFAKKLIESDIATIFKNKLLNHENKFLAEEIVFSFLDHKFFQSELKHDIYHLEDIDVDYSKLNRDRLSLDPFRIFLDSFNFLKSINIEYVINRYSQDYPMDNRLNRFSTEDLKTNLKTFFNNLPLIYQEIVTKNFPNIEDELPIFNNASKIIIIFDVNEYENYEDHSGIKILYLYNKNNSDKDIGIELYADGENPNLPNIHNNGKILNELELDGEIYEIRNNITSNLDFLYLETPMLNYVYKELENNLNLFKTKSIL